ncbi:hypothetical protein ACQJBY_006472 [Aegilops geniculata]
MGIPMSWLIERNMQFHGVIAGKKAKSVGQIALDVVFGDSKNFRKEKLTFEMPKPKGVITVTRNRQRAEGCLQKGSKITNEQMAVVELEEYKKNVDPSDLLWAKKPASESAFQSASEMKPVNIHPEDPTAAPTHISTTLDSK